MFVQKYMEKHYFCGQNSLIEGKFLTQVSSNIGISVWQIVWVMTNCCCMGNIRLS